MAGEFDAGAGGLLGTRDLQQSIDEFDTAVKTLSSTITNMATSMGNGMTRSPIGATGAAGHYITSGSFPAMQPALFGNLTPSQTRGAVILGQGNGQTANPAPTMGQTAAGGGTIGGGATINGQPVLGGGGPPGGPPGGGGGGGNGGSSGGSGGTLNNNAAGGGANGGGATFGGSGGSGGGPPGVYGGSGGGTTPPPGSGGTQAQFLARGASAIAGGIMAYGASQYNNMLFYNAYGTQMAAQYGQVPQTAQNAAFGNGDYSVWNAAAGNPQSAASAVATLSQMAPSTNANAYASTAAFGATNAFALTNQGLGAAGAAQLAGQVYNPVSSLRMQLLTGQSAINPLTGKQNSLSSIIGGLSGMGYLGGGSYNQQTGTYSQKALNASFTAGRGTSYMNLQSLGYSTSQIQDIQSTMSQANQVANTGHTSFHHVMNLMNTAEGGPGVGEAQTQSAIASLKKLDPNFNLSTIQQQGNLSSLHMAQSQNESGAYNKAVQDVTAGMMKLTQAINWLLDHTGLNHALGTSGGIMGGLQSTGLGGITSLIGDALPGITGQIGGGAGNVSVTQSMTSQGSTPGSSMSSVSSQVTTAVRDAEAQVGKPYVYGGDNPKTSFDCSGLVMWAYDMAGVHLPRTSQEQWSFLKNKSVPANQAQEGDVVFQAGSDGTAAQPGHEALMISNNQIVEAPHTGADIRIRSYNPGEWQHVARPVGGSGGGTGGSSPVSGTQQGYAGSSAFSGNAGSSLSGGDNDLGLTTDADSMLFGGAATGGGGGAGGAMRTTTNGSKTSNSGGSGGSLPTGGNSTQNEALAKKMAAQMYGWKGSQWSQGLLPLWTQESHFDNTAQNPTSTAYGIAQFLDTTWGPYGPKTSNPQKQIQYGLEYIKGRYKTPLSAEAHEKAYNWYGDGTDSAAPGYALVGDRGPELVRLSGGQQIHTASETSNILRGTAALPAQGPWTSTPAQHLLLDILSPANNASRQGGGITVHIGDITISAPNLTGNQMSSDVQVLGQLIVKQVEEAMARSTLIKHVAEGNTG